MICISRAESDRDTLAARSGGSGPTPFLIRVMYDETTPTMEGKVDASTRESSYTP
jgi:hypothetical protein